MAESGEAPNEMENAPPPAASPTTPVTSNKVDTLKRKKVGLVVTSGVIAVIALILGFTLGGEDSTEVTATLENTRFNDCSNYGVPGAYSYEGITCGTCQVTGNWIYYEQCDNLCTGWEYHIIKNIFNPVLSTCNTNNVDVPELDYEGACPTDFYVTFEQRGCNPTTPEQVTLADIQSRFFSSVDHTYQDCVDHCEESEDCVGFIANPENLDSCYDVTSDMLGFCDDVQEDFTFCEKARSTVTCLTQQAITFEEAEQRCNNLNGLIASGRDEFSFSRIQAACEAKIGDDAKGCWADFGEPDECFYVNEVDENLTASDCDDKRFFCCEFPTDAPTASPTFEPIEFDINPTPSPFQEAVDFCGSSEFELARILSEGDQTQAAEKCDEIVGDDPTACGCWISVQSNADNDFFFFGDNEPVDFLNLGPGIPDFQPPSAFPDRCYVLRKILDYRWDDVDCLAGCGDGISNPVALCTERAQEPTSSPTKNPTLPTFAPTGNPTTPNPTGSPTITRAPTSSPSGTPTFSPTKLPTDVVPTQSPSATPTFSPTKLPTDSPTASPSVEPTRSPIKSPTISPTTAPTDSPTTSPTKNPTKAPTTSPTKSPTNSPTVSPTGSPSVGPTVSPSRNPTTSPTASPTDSPTTSPTKNPTNSPTTSPTDSPTKNPTTSPTSSPTTSPTTSPTSSPTASPTLSPTDSPTLSPSSSPTTSPTASPSISPTTSPSLSPTTTAPTRSPSNVPSTSPTAAPSRSPTSSPTANPTVSPTGSPTVNPTRSPTDSPTLSPTKAPTDSPTKSPSAGPTVSPTNQPTRSPTKQPTDSPTVSPTNSPSTSPSASPSQSPTDSPIKAPTGTPTKDPTQKPTSSPTKSPTVSPTVNPTKSPSGSPTANPTKSPTRSPTFSPTDRPTGSPVEAPTPYPTKSPNVHGVCKFKNGEALWTVFNDGDEDIIFHCYYPQSGYSSYVYDESRYPACSYHNTYCPLERFKVKPGKTQNVVAPAEAIDYFVYDRDCPGHGDVNTIDECKKFGGVSDTPDRFCKCVDHRIDGDNFDSYDLGESDFLHTWSKFSGSKAFIRDKSSFNNNPATCASPNGKCLDLVGKVRDKKFHYTAHLDLKHELQGLTKYIDYHCTAHFKAAGSRRCGSNSFFKEKDALAAGCLEYHKFKFINKDNDIVVKFFRPNDDLLTKVTFPNVKALTPYTHFSATSDVFDNDGKAYLALFSQGQTVFKKFKKTPVGNFFDDLEVVCCCIELFDHYIHGATYKAQGPTGSGKSVPLERSDLTSVLNKPANDDFNVNYKGLPPSTQVYSLGLGGVTILSFESGFSHKLIIYEESVLKCKFTNKGNAECQFDDFEEDAIVEVSVDGINFVTVSASLQAENRWQILDPYLTFEGTQRRLQTEDGNETDLDEVELPEDINIASASETTSITQVDDFFTRSSKFQSFSRGLAKTKKSTSFFAKKIRFVALSLPANNACYKYVRLTDISTGGNRDSEDGFDLHAIKTTNVCCTEQNNDAFWAVEQEKEDVAYFESFATVTTVLTEGSVATAAFIVAGLATIVFVIGLALVKRHPAAKESANIMDSPTPKHISAKLEAAKLDLEEL